MVNTTGITIEEKKKLAFELVDKIVDHFISNDTMCIMQDYEEEVGINIDEAMRLLNPETTEA